MIFSDLFLPTVSCLEAIANASTADWRLVSSLVYATLFFHCAIGSNSESYGLHKGPECKATRPMC